MQVIILAAGNSTRFVPFNTDLSHKSLIKIMGKTILEHMLLSIKKTNIEDVVIVVSRDSAIKNVIGDGSSFGLHINYVVLPVALGMGAAIQAAYPLLQESFFVLNANHIEFNEFAEKMVSLQKNKETVVMLGKEDADFSQFGFMKVNKTVVDEVVEKPTRNLEDWHRIVGIYLLNKSFIEVLNKTPLEHYHFEKALSAYAKMGKVSALIINKQTLSLKYAWDLFAIKDYLLSTIVPFVSKSAQISEKAQISGDVYISDGVKVMEGAKIKGPCFVGKNAYVGTNSLLRNGTIMEEGSVAGSFLELKNTILMAFATTHTGVIEDSIIGEHCKIAAGIITANVRLDRKEIPAVVKEEKVNTKLTSFGVIVGNNSQLGVRVTTMPGIIIGQNVLIGPDTVVMQNVPENVKYYTKFKEIIEERKTNGKK